MVYNDGECNDCLQRAILCRTTLCLKRKATAIILLATIPSFTEKSAKDCQDTRAINIASPTVKPFNTLSYKKTQRPHHVYITVTVLPAAEAAAL